MKWFRRAFAVAIVFLLAFALAGTAHADGILSLPNGLHDIEEEAFFGDTSLNIVVVPESVGSIGDRAFANSSVSWINIPWGLNALGDDVFANTQLQGIIVREDSPVVQQLEANGLGDLIRYNNDFDMWPWGHESRIFVPYGETTVIGVDVSAACDEGLRFFWYRIESIGDGYNQWVDLPDVNGPSLETDPITEKVSYFCRVEDLFGNQRAVWFDVMVDNGLEIWAENDQQGVYADADGNATLRVWASADDESELSFNWYRIVHDDEYGFDEWQELEGENGLSLSLSGVTGHETYVARVTDRFGGTAECWFDVDVEPAETSVVSSAARDITATSAFIDLRYSVKKDLLDQGYRVGVVYAENPDDLSFNEESQFFENAMLWAWGGESGIHGPANDAEYTACLDELIPGHTYYYRGVIIRESSYTAVAWEDAVRSFRTAAGNDLASLSLTSGGFARRADDGDKTVFRFVVPQDGVYVLRADIDMDEMSVRRTDNMQTARDNDCSELSFVGYQGETLYLFVCDFASDAHLTLEFAGELPDEDAVWPISVEDVTATAASIKIGYTATEETAQNGYHVGVAFTPNREDLLVLNERGQFDCAMWWWEDLHAPALNTSFERRLDELVPGTTYYYRAILIVNDRVVACGSENDIGSFTTAPIDTLPVIGETQWGQFNWTPIESGDKVAFRFIPDRDGFFGLMANKQLGSMGVIMSGRNYANMEYNTDMLFFFGHEGQPVVLFAQSWEDGAAVLVRWFIEPATEDSVSATVANDGAAVGSTWANLKVTADVTEETANNGFHIGVAFSQNAEDLELDENEQRFRADMWNWDYLDMPMNDGEFDRMLDRLIPESTYYFRAFILVFDRVIACDENIQSFTTGSANGVAVIGEDESYVLDQNELTALRFTAQQSGIYRLSLSSSVDQIDVIRTDGRRISGGNDERNEARFYADAGESVYLYLRTWDENNVRAEISFVAAPPEDDGISTSRIEDMGDFRAKLTVTLNVTPETAENGYAFGVEYSPNESFRDDEGNQYSGDFFWWYSEDVAMGQDEEVWLNCLVPGVTYYYRGFIDYCNGNRIVEDEIHSFTAPGDPEDIPALTLNQEWSTNADDGSRFFRFTAPESGVYVLKGSANFSLYNSEGMGMYGSDWEENNARSATHAMVLKKDETVFVNINIIDGWAKIMISDDAANLDSLRLREWHDLRDNNVVCFTAPAEGWYNFTVDQAWLGDLHYYNSYVEDWSDRMGLGYNVDTISLYAVEGETLYFNTWYDMNLGLMRIYVDEAASPDENEVFSLAPEVGDTWATMEIHFSVTEDTLMSHYGEGYIVGIAYSPFETFMDENGNDATNWWGWDPMRVLADSRIVTRTLDRLVPNATYYYYVFLSDAETGEVFAQENVKSFTTTASAGNIPELTLGETLAVPDNGSSVFMFHSETPGMYAVVTHGPWDFEVRDGVGNWITSTYSELMEIGPDCGTGFLGGEDEMFYIFVFNGDPNATISIENGLEALPVLTVGEMSEELWGRQVACFTAPADGWYRFESFSDWYGRLAIATPETGWVNSEYDEQRVTRYLHAGETVYPGCWFDDEWARVRLLVTAVEIPQNLSVHTLDVEDVTDVSALFRMSFEMPLLNDTQRYHYGIVIKPVDDPAFAGGEAWFEGYIDNSLSNHDRHDPMELHTEYFSELPLYPETSYYYEAYVFLFDEENDQWDVYFGGLKSFTTLALNREIRAVNAEEEISLRWIEGNDYQMLSFTVPQDPADLYTVSVSDASIWVSGADAHVYWPMDNYGERTCYMPGVGHEGETYTIYLRVWRDEGIRFSIEEHYAQPAEIGMNSELSQNSFYRVTAPVAGDYLFAVSGERSMTVINTVSGEIMDSWYWVEQDQVQEGDAFLFYFHLTDKWSPEDGVTANVAILPNELSVSTEAELRSAEDAALLVTDIDPFLSFFDINVDAPITLSADLHSPTIVMLNLNDALTVPSGRSLLIEGDGFVNEGGSLLVRKGGTLELRGFDEGWYATLQIDGGTVSMDGNFLYDEHTFIRLHPEEYADVNAALAAAGNLPRELFVIEVKVSSAEELAAAAALDPSSFSSFTLNLIDGYSPAFADLAAFNLRNTTIITNEGTSLVIPAGAEQSLNASLRINQASVTVNGDLSVADGGMILLMGGGSLVNNGNLTIGDGGMLFWAGETYVENNGVLTVGDGSRFALSTSKDAPDSCEVMNNGTVYLSYDIQEEIQFVGDGDVFHLLVS